MTGPGDMTPDDGDTTSRDAAPPGQTRRRRGAFAGASEDDTRRLEAFSDGVFAIAITLLVLNFDIPAELSTDGIWPAITAQSDQFISAAISFAVIGVYWAGHHTTFRRIERGSAALTVVNLMLLATIVFLPFPTLVLAEYSGTFPAVALYAGTLALAGFSAAALSVVALRQGLLAPDVDASLVQARIAGLLSTPIVFTLSIGVAAVNPGAAMWFWLLAMVADRPVSIVMHRFIGGTDSTG